MSDATTRPQSLGGSRLGERSASEDLLPLVYDELRRLARARMAGLRPGQTLQPTALVHEAYLRLVRSSDQGWENRGHFFAAAAEAMRRIVIDRARRAARAKHGGDRVRITISAVGGVARSPIEEYPLPCRADRAL